VLVLAQSGYPGWEQPDVWEGLMSEFFSVTWMILFVAWIIFLVAGTVVLITSMMLEALLDVWENLRRHLRWSLSFR
jgi:hypothetical protein